MGIETLNAMNEGMHLNLLMIIEVIMLINILLAIAGFVIYLAGTAWYCLGETRQPPRRQMKSAPEPPEPDEYDLPSVPARMDDEPIDNLTGSVSRTGVNFIRVSRSFLSRAQEEK